MSSHGITRDLASTMDPLVVVSPHYDDAVFSCGNLLALAPGSTVVTVYTGLPEKADILTDWDRRCGFSSARDAMQARALENRKALGLLHAAGIDLEFLDSQYARRRENGADLLSDTLASTITQIQPAAVFFPLGLFHEDHINVSDVLITICHRFPTIHWFVYEDIPYRQQSQRVVQRLSKLVESGVGPTPIHVKGMPEYKAMAVEAYQSQFRGLGYDDGRPVLRQAEQYWRLHCSMDLL
ncbi:PIG-L family deacetylase [Eoetvoesiella caeni]